MTEPAATEPAATAEPARPEPIKLDVTAQETSTAQIAVTRDQLLAGLDREAQLQASLNALAQRYITEKGEWDVERDGLLAQIERLRSGEDVAPPARNRESLPPAVPSESAPGKQAARKAARKR